MHLKPVLFISAVSDELRTARQVVANTLSFMGYEAQWQDVFSLEHGEILSMLRKRIDQASGVIQIVGNRYGFTVSDPGVEDSISYTQYEAYYARQKGKKVWYLITNEDFVGDVCAPEDDQKRLLQATYRRSLTSAGHLYHPISNINALEASVLRLREDLRSLRWRAKLFVATTFAILIAVLILVASIFVEQHTTKVHQQRVLAALMLIAEKEQEIRRIHPALPLTRVRTEAYVSIEKHLGLPKGSLSSDLPALAREVAKDTRFPSAVRAQAEYLLRNPVSSGNSITQPAATELTVPQKYYSPEDQRSNPQQIPASQPRQFASSISIATEEDAKVKREFGVDAFTTPPLENLFSLLAGTGHISRAKLTRPFDRTIPPDRIMVSLGLGTYIADGLSVVHTHQLADMEEAGRCLIKFAKVLGAGSRMSRHSQSLVELAIDEQWQALRQELINTQKDVEIEMVQLRDPALARMVGLGGWIRGLEIAANSVKDDYSVDRSRLLIQTEVLDYYLACFSDMPEPMQTHTTLRDIHARLGVLKTKYEGRISLSKAEIQDILAEATSLCDLIRNSP